MTNEIQEIRERQAEAGTRLINLEKSLAEIHTDLCRLARIVNGNGEDGLFGQIQMSRERIDVLQRQWKWVIGVLAALVLAALKTSFVG